jgi:hypothetical protein
MRDLAEFETCSRDSIRGSYYRGVRVIDSELSEYGINKVTLIGPKPPFWGFSLLHKRAFLVKIDYKLVGTLSFPEAREIVAQMFLKHRAFWTAYGDSKEFSEDCLKLENLDALIAFIDGFRRGRKRK